MSNTEIAYWIAKMHHAQTVDEFDQYEHHAFQAAEESGKRLVNFNAGPVMRHKWREWILAQQRQCGDNHDGSTRFWREPPEE